jgi:hypothetical protein
MKIWNREKAQSEKSLEAIEQESLPQRTTQQSVNYKLNDNKK